MKNKTITIYEYSELSDKAKEKALSWHQEHGFDNYGLQVYLDNELAELLEKNKISLAYPKEYAKIQWSLGYSQGDGLMFEGAFTWRGYTAKIRHSGHYSHKYSRIIDWYEKDGSDASEETKEYKQFVSIYKDICDVLEKIGYAYIEDVNSEAYFIDACNANEWTFREDGTMENA